MPMSMSSESGPSKCWEIKFCQTLRDSGERDLVISAMQSEHSIRGRAPSISEPSWRNCAEIEKPWVEERGQEHATHLLRRSAEFSSAIHSRRRFSHSISFSRKLRMVAFDESLNSEETLSRHFSQTAYSRVHSPRW